VGGRAVAVMFGTVLLLVLAAGPAQAHSTLDSSSPAQGAQVAVRPTVVVLHFSEGVGVNAGSLAVLDHDGRRVDSRRPQQPRGDPDGVQVALPPGLPRGSYAVVWRVVSADGHPVSGTFSFGFGVPAGAPAAQTLPDLVTGALHGFFTLTGYLGAILLVGVGFFLLVVWPDGLRAARPWQLLRAGWWLSVWSAVALFVLQGPYGAGLGPGEAVDPALLAQTLTGQLGLLMVLRLFVLGLAVAAGPWPGTDPVSSLRRDTAGLAVLFLPTFSLAGHSGEGPLAALTVLTDALHLAAAGVWLGGLAVLLGVLLRAPRRAPRPGGDPQDGVDGVDGIDLLDPSGVVLRRWSRVAMGAVGVLAATGAFQTWREVSTLAALPATTYGRLLLAKLAGVAVLLVLGDQGRRWIRRQAARPAPQRRLRGSVTAEVVVGVTVLGLTTVLVGTLPARESFAGPFSVRVAGQGADGSQISVVIDVSSTRSGAQSIGLNAYRADGRLLSVRGATGSLARDSGRTDRTGPVRSGSA
jgi:copper transport protein